MRALFFKTVGLLRKYKRLWVVITAIAGTAAFTIPSIIFEQYEWMYLAFLLVLMTGWEISDVFLFEKREQVQLELADVKDKLCLSEHKVERLTQELEVAQAALLEAKTPRNTTPQKAEAVAEDISSEESSVKEIAPKPKRKPATRGTRKQRPKNENKN